MHTLHASDATNPDPTRFRGPTFEEAMAVATAELGPKLEVVEANRIRRGGLGGFFATDLGVEVAVRPAIAAGADGEAPEPATGPASAIEQLLAKAEAVERAIAEPNNFAAVLAGELGESIPATGPNRTAMGPTTAEWSAEAYRQLAIPASDRSARETSGGGVPAEPAPTAARKAAPNKPAAKTAPNKPAAKTAAAGTATTKPAAPRKPSTRRAPSTPKAGAAGAAAEPSLELASHAVAALLAQLTAQAPPPGSFAERITTLTVKVTTPSGDVEISAALGAAS